MNIRFNLEQAWQKGVISTIGKDRLLRCAQALYFPERSYEGMMEKGENWSSIDQGRTAIACQSHSQCGMA